MTIEHEIISFSVKRYNKIKKKLDSTLKKLADTTTALDYARRENRELRTQLEHSRSSLNTDQSAPKSMRARFNSPQELYDRQDHTKSSEPPAYKLQKSRRTIRKALKNYEHFHNLQPNSATEQMVENSSAGIEGWASFTPEEEEQHLLKPHLPTSGSG